MNPFILPNPPSINYKGLLWLKTLVLFGHWELIWAKINLSQPWLWSLRSSSWMLQEFLPPAGHFQRSPFSSIVMVTIYMHSLRVLCDTICDHEYSRLKSLQKLCILLNSFSMNYGFINNHNKGKKIEVRDIQDFLVLVFG